MQTSYKISEIFHSIQGEGKRAGMPCIFLRFQGCNLRCKWCDTEYAQDIKAGKTFTFNQIVKKVESFDCKFIEFTGGEPLLQENFIELIRYFSQKDYTVAIETNGSIDISKLPENVIRIIDVKCPSSGMVEHFNIENLLYINSNDEIKFVIANEEDYEWAKDFYLREIRYKIKAEIIFSPAFSLLEPKSLAEWILRDGLEVRMQLQLHKYIWHPEERGV